MRKTVKILHSLASCGLIGGVTCYMALLAVAPEDDTAAYASIREYIAIISNYVLLPSLVIVLISGLVAMVVHKPYLHKGWVGIKALLGILMFKGVLTLIGSNANHMATVAREIADGEAPAQSLEDVAALEWGMLSIVMAISIANVVLAIWRPRIVRPIAQNTPAGEAPAKAARN